MRRQRQLERALWTIIRVRESEFYTNRKNAIDKVIQECERTNIKPWLSTEDASVQTISSAGSGSPTDISPQRNEGPELAEEGIESEALADTDEGPFTGYGPSSNFPDPRYASPANIKRALLTIVGKDGPLTRDSLYRLYSEGCPDLGRVGRVVRAHLDRAAAALLLSDEIVEEDQLEDGSPEGVVFRLSGHPRVRERPAGRRDLLEIPASEIFLLLDKLDFDKNCSPAIEPAFMRSILDHFNYTRLTQPRRHFLRRVFRAYIAARK